MKNKMPAIFLVAIAALLLSFTMAQQYTIRLSEEKLNYHWRNLQSIKQLIDQSQLPHNQVKFMLNAIDSLQADISQNLKTDSIPKTK